MHPLIVSRQQLISWVIVTGIGFAFWLASDILWGLGAGIIVFSQFIIMTPAERSRALTKRDLAAGVIFIGILIGCGFVAEHYFSQDTMRAVEHLMRHPAIVIPFWAGCVCLMYRRWRLSDGRHPSTA